MIKKSSLKVTDLEVKTKKYLENEKKWIALIKSKNKKIVGQVFVKFSVGKILLSSFVKQQNLKEIYCSELSILDIFVRKNSSIYDLRTEDLEIVKISLEKNGVIIKAKEGNEKFIGQVYVKFYPRKVDLKLEELRTDLGKVESTKKEDVIKKFAELNNWYFDYQIATDNLEYHPLNDYYGTIKAKKKNSFFKGRIDLSFQL